jgi:hypothetical protein
VDTTNLLNGTSGKALPPDFVDTVQAKASGYAAEYRASLGGVISAITKSGGNGYHGGAGIYWTSDSLQGDVRQTLRLSPSNQNIAEYVTTPLDQYSSLGTRNLRLVIVFSRSQEDDLRQFGSA